MLFIQRIKGKLIILFQSFQLMSEFFLLLLSAPIDLPHLIFQKMILLTFIIIPLRNLLLQILQLLV